MRVIDLPLDQLREAHWNPNRMDPAMQSRLRESLSRFGPVVNLVVRPLGPEVYEVLSGNQRLQALRNLGFASALCVAVELADAPARLLAQALNRVMGEDEPGLKVELLRDLLAQLPQEDILAVLPETSQGLGALGSLGQQNLAEALREWDRAKQYRLRHLTFQLVQAQSEIVDQAVETEILAVNDNSDPNNPNPRGNALYRICQWYLQSITSEPEEDSHDQGND